MPTTRPYTITASATSIKIERSRRTEITLTVTNQTERSLRTEVRLKLLDDKLDDCIQLAGESILDIPAGQSTQVTVMAEFSNEISSGDYRFRLDAIGVNRPEEDFAEGPVVSLALEKPVEQPAKEGIKWWQIAIGVGAVALVAWIAFPKGSDRNSVKMVKVPGGLVGDSYHVVSEELQKLGFLVEGQSVPTLNAKSTAVLSLKPAEHELPEGSTIHLEFAIDGVEVPSSKNKTAMQMADLLTRSNLSVEKIQGASKDPEKVIAGLRPSSGTVVPEWSSVTIVVTRGGRILSKDEFIKVQPAQVMTQWKLMDVNLQAIEKKAAVQQKLMPVTVFPVKKK